MQYKQERRATVPLCTYMWNILHTNKLTTSNYSLESYLKMVTEMVPEKNSLKLDPFVFWESQPGKYEHIGQLAYKFLSVPATWASVERVFSQTGLCSTDRKNRIAAKLLNQKCFIHLKLSQMISIWICNELY